MRTPQASPEIHSVRFCSSCSNGGIRVTHRTPRDQRAKIVLEWHTPAIGATTSRLLLDWGLWSLKSSINHKFSRSWDISVTKSRQFCSHGTYSSSEVTPRPLLDFSICNLRSATTETPALPSWKRIQGCFSSWSHSTRSER